VGREAGYFVAKTFRWNYSNFIDDPFVGVEVEGKTGVILLDEDS